MADSRVVSLRPPLRDVLWPFLAFVVTAALVYPLANHWIDPDAARSVRSARAAVGVVMLITTFVAMIPFLVVAGLLSGPPPVRGGWTLLHAPIVPIADGYRTAQAPTIGDLVGRLETLGYRLAVRACDRSGRARRPIDRSAPLAGSDVLLRDRRWAGDVRLVLAPPADRDRQLGRLEVRANLGTPTEELARFVLRELDGLVPGLRASPADSALPADPVRLVTSGLGAEPRFGAAGSPDGSLA